MHKIKWAALLLPKWTAYFTASLIILLPCWPAAVASYTESKRRDFHGFLGNVTFQHPTYFSVEFRYAYLAVNTFFAPPLCNNFIAAVGKKVVNSWLIQFDHHNKHDSFLSYFLSKGQLAFLLFSTGRSISTLQDNKVKITR